MHDYWQNWFVPGISDFVRIPNLSPLFDAEYQTNGLLEKAMDCVDEYITKLEIANLEKRIFKPPGGNPLIVYKVEPQNWTKNIMVYGHLDKQPYEEAWAEGLHPTEPVIRGTRLYGRGAHDDGYSAFTTMLAIKAAQLRGAELPRICLVLETEEESGSESLISLLEMSADYVGKPDCLFCMDSGCIDYERLWITSSLRGVAILDLEVAAAQGGYHSGEVGGIVPETFRVVRALLDRIDDRATGRVVESLQSEVPKWKLDEARDIVADQGSKLYEKFPLVEGVQYMNQDDLVEMYLDGVWRANLSITGAAGLPDYQKAGNVVRSSTTVRLSLRISPEFDSKKAIEELTELLTKDVPYNAKVTITNANGGDGFCMGELKPWLQETINEAGQVFFSAPTGLYGEGGSIPFLHELQAKYPDTQIVPMGCGGPESNAHGANEFLELDYC